jgi:hypothetical protein
MVEIVDYNEPPLDLNENDTKIKNFLVDYVGELKEPEDGNVTVEMVIDVVADEFPELVLALAEENWIRGYQQALTDVSVGERLKREESEP